MKRVPRATIRRRFGSGARTWCRCAAIALPVVALAWTPLPVAADPLLPAGDGETSSHLEEFSRRRSQLSRSDDAGAMKLAEWAVERGLLDQADDLYRDIIERSPDHEEAYAALWYISGGRNLDKDSFAYKQTRRQLPETFKEYETLRYVVLSDAEPEWTREQTKRLERTYDRFVRFARMLDLPVLPIRHKLVAVVFNDLDEFQKFSRNDETPAGMRIAGYYHVPTDRLVFYHVESNENIARARQELESLEAEIEAVRRASRRVSSTGRRAEGRAMLDGLDERVARHNERLDRLNAFAVQRSIAVTVHEAVHQLMFHTRVQSPYVQHPLWLSEGLATSFETEDTASSFGPLQDYAPRRQQFYHYLDNDQLIPLRDLVTITGYHASNHPNAVDVLYHQSYALTAWLCRHRKLEFNAYLAKLNAIRGQPTPETYRTIFEESFGDIDRLEKIWLRQESD